MRKDILLSMIQHLRKTTTRNNATLTLGYVKRRDDFNESCNSRICHFIYNNIEVGHFRIDYYDNCYTIWDLYINHKYRDKGYGQKMLQECIKSFNDKPIECYCSAYDSQILHILQKYNFNIVKKEQYGKFCGYQMRREVK